MSKNLLRREKLRRLFQEPLKKAKEALSIGKADLTQAKKRVYIRKPPQKRYVLGKPIVAQKESPTGLLAALRQWYKSWFKK